VEASMKRKPLAVVAFGGNALHPPDQRGTQREQFRNAYRAARRLTALLRAGYRLLVVHGNGPQVGSILIQMEEASTKVPPFSLDVAVAMSQGSMGYMIGLALQNYLTRLGRAPRVVCVLTEVVVDEDDPAFVQPTKPIGPFFTAYRASVLARKKRWTIVEDAGRGYRRVVASPRPREVLNLEAIRALLEQDYVVIAGGGGGIPVIRTERGLLRGVEAVIDKDYTSGLLASQLGADLFVILTGVPAVALDYRTPRQRWLDRMTVEEAEQYMQAGHFPPGSMGPKVEAAIAYLRSGGSAVLITSIDELPRALRGEGGTRIVP
jgi:carbamate kinase